MQASTLDFVGLVSVAHAVIHAEVRAVIWRVILGLGKIQRQMQWALSRFYEAAQQ